MPSPEKPTVIVDPDDRSIMRHSKVGPWDLYEDISGTRKVFGIPFLSKARAVMEAYKGYPVIKRMVQDILSITGCWPYFVLWFIVKLLLAFMPAINLWYSGQLLQMVSQVGSIEDIFLTMGITA